MHNPTSSTPIGTLSAPGAASIFFGQLLLIFAVVFTYIAAIHSPFIFDDTYSVATNTSLNRLWPLIGDAEHPGPLNPAHDLPTSGRPLVNLSLAVNYRLGEANPLGYHLFNLVVHTLSALLLMAIVRRILALDFFGGAFAGAEGALAFVVALVWALHPVQTETVVYITQRTELLVGFFYLATLYSSLRYWQADSPAARGTWLTLATLACLCGMASKEVMVTAPVVILLLERTLLRGSFRQALKQSWPLYAGLALGWALLALLNYSAPRSDSAGFHAGIPALTWWFTQCKVLWLYVKLVFWPWPLLIHYEMPYLTTLSAAWPWVLASGLLVAGILVLLWRRSAIGYAGAWMLLILSPTLVVPIVTEVAAERRLYLPLAAMLTLLVTGGYWGATKCFSHFTPKAARRTRSILAVIALILVSLSSFVTFQRLRAYQNPVALWQGVLKSQPDDPLGHNNLAISLDQTGDDANRAARLQQAIDELETAIRLKPDYADAHYNLGVALAKSGMLHQAIEQYQRALQLRPMYAETEDNLAIALALSGQPDAAIQQFQNLIQHRPDDAKARNNFGLVLLQQEQLPKAIEQFEQAIRLNPDYVQAYCNLAEAYVKSGRETESRQNLQTAAQIARAHGQNSLATQIETRLHGGPPSSEQHP